MDRRRARLLRILGDGARPQIDESSLRTPVLRQVENEADIDSRPPSADDELRRRDEIRRRLAYFDRRDAAQQTSAHLASASHSSGQAKSKLVEPHHPELAPAAISIDPRVPAGLEPAACDLGVRLMAGLRETPFGSCLQAERRIPMRGARGTQLLGNHGKLFGNHGNSRLGLCLDLPHLMHPRERGPDGCASLNLTDAAFLDTETTGLVGGTGTVAFMVGVGRVEIEPENHEPTFVVTQYAMRDYPDEAAMLYALQRDIGNAPLVTFNGRSYDWPLLQTRWRMHRPLWRQVELDPLRSIPAERAHLDLLTHARRLWSRTLHSRSLATLERHVIGLHRGEDLSGAAIPTAWFRYLQTGDGLVIARAFEHNVVDIVSMVALLGHVSNIVTHPERPVPAPADHLGAARLMMALELTSQAATSLATGIDVVEEAEARPLHRLLATIYRRAGNYDQAIHHWSSAARTSKLGIQPPEHPPIDIDACEHVAKLYEHKFRRFDAALEWTDVALEAARHGTPTQRDLLHRAERLRRRLARTQAAISSTQDAP